jgi:hypothetical protein
VRTWEGLQKGAWRQRAWWMDGTLQIQRRAFEGFGVREWVVVEKWDRVPVTEKGLTFRALGEWDGEVPAVAEPEKASSMEKQEPNMTIAEVDSNSSGGLNEDMDSMAMESEAGQCRRV